MVTRTAFTASAAAGIALAAVVVGAGMMPAQAATPTPSPTASATVAPTAPATSGTPAAPGTPPVFSATQLRAYDTFDAHQAVAVDDRYFYAIDNQSITKHDRKTGAPLLQFVGDANGPIIHMDSGVVVGSKLYAATSNYNTSPEKSSIEVFDTRTMKHIDTFSFGIYRGSITWLDWHDNAWWATFANYDKPGSGSTSPYGQTDNTQVVKLDRDFQVVESWTVPQAILDDVRPMSISGGSWGPDGRLWLSGHDWDKAYVMTIPTEGSDLTWVSTVGLPNVEGQGIAWDRSTRQPTLWTIKRSTSQVLTFSAPVSSITDPTKAQWQVFGPGHFQQ